MITPRSLFVVAVVGAVLISGVAVPVAAQEQVTLTVTVETPTGGTVQDAELTATWSNGSTTETTSANGKAFLDVPEGANVTIEVDHPEAIRNNPVEVTDASERDVTITVFDRASATITVQDDDGAVSDARVRFYKGDRLAVDERTQDGVVETGDIEEGEYRVFVNKPGYITRGFQLDVENETTTTVDFERGTVTLHVNVTDPHFDPPRPIAEVTAEVEGIGTVQTQSTGQQQVNVPVNTDLTVNVEKDGYESVEQRVRIRESDVRMNVSMDRTPALNVEAFSNQVVVGEPVGIEVVNEYEEPVADATVTFDGESVTTTDDEGEARITVESEGNHTIQVSKDGLESDPVTVKGVEALTPTTTTNETTTTSEPTTTAMTTTTEESTVPVPGFGPVAAILAILGTIALLAGRRRT